MGGIGGALLGVGLRAAAERDWDCDVRCWIPAPVAFAILGTFAGAVLGSSVPRWKEIDDRETLDPRLRVAPMTELRVRIPGAMITGHAARLSHDSLVLRRRLGTSLRRTVYDSTTVGLADVENVWVRIGTKTRKGAVIGGVLGAAFGLTFLFVTPQGDLSPGDLARALTPSMALIGITVGGWIGSGSPLWEPYPWPPR